MSEKILVTGSTGLVGSRFVELHENKDELLTPTSSEMDVTEKESAEGYMRGKDIRMVVNFAAHTNLNAAEEERGKKGACWRLNVDGVENLISALPSGTHFIQISTDNVFSGSKEKPGPYNEDDIPEVNSDKLTWYGFTKAEAEREILSRLKRKSTILRIIYPFRSHYDRKLDYVRKPLYLFDQGKLYPMFMDQQVSVIFIDKACQALERIIELKRFGIFHASSSNTTTPFELFSYLLEKTKGVKNVIKKSSIDNVGNPVRYPKFGGLKVEKTEKELGIKFGTWRQMVDEFISQI